MSTLNSFLAKLEKEKKVQDIHGFAKFLEDIREKYKKKMEKEVNSEILNELIDNEKRPYFKSLLSELKNHLK
jgi:glutamyl-tRNA reductase